MGESVEEDMKFFDQSSNADGILGSVFSYGIQMGEQEKKPFIHRFLSWLASRRGKEMMQE